MGEKNEPVVGGINFGPATGGDAVKHAVKTLAENGVELVKVEPGEVNYLKDVFRRQTELIDRLVAGDKLPEYPIDITSKYGQKLIKELIWAMVEEMAEASFILKNRSHRFTDHTDVDFAHFKEELADALSYFVEICIYADIDFEELFSEYCRKNFIVKKRVEDGY